MTNMVGLSDDCWNDRCDECEYQYNCTCEYHEEDEDD